jgi:formamidopyrimidine-DNA glycosylase
MPELPEVETVVRGLSKHLPGQTIKQVEILSAKSFLWSAKLKDPSVISGLKILSLSRRGKGIVIQLTKGYCLLIHLKMTGQLIYIDKTQRRLNYGHPDQNFLDSMPSRHTRAYLTLSKGTLYFNDQRRFGWIKLTREEWLDDDPFLKKLGVEPLSKKFSLAHFSALLTRRSKSTIKAVLLDQTGVVGVGNIYADEILFDSKIRPTRLAQALTPKEIASLFASIPRILKLGIKHSGTSINTYKTPSGSPGQMQNYLMAYEQDKKPCKVCGGKIQKIRVAGRGTHYCPHCQK